MPLSQRERLKLALVGFGAVGGASRLTALLRGKDGFRTLSLLWNDLAPNEASAIYDEVEDLVEKQVDAWFLGQEGYPSRLMELKKPPPVLFAWGNRELGDSPGVAMCGSRNASPQGLDAARACGEVVARRGLTIISGNARGVDTETHLAALSMGGTTVMVLAEGIAHFKPKRVFRNVRFDAQHVLVLSQFAPTQTWTPGGAMTRNGTIAGLGEALIVIEAGETGGTLNAGLQAISMGRPVLALDFSNGIPPGNQILFDKGAWRVRSKGELNRALASLADAPPPTPGRSQLSFLE